MERNLAEHACHLHRRTKHMTVTETPDVVFADSGLDDDTFNIVALARFAPRDTDLRIADTIRHLRGTGRPFAWWVGPASAPDDLSDRLTAAGLPLEETSQAMWAHLGEIAVDAAEGQDGMPGFAVRAATDGDTLADFADVLASLWDPPAATVREFFAATATTALAPGSAARYLVGYLDGEPVASAEVFGHADLAGIYNIGTREAHRKHGYGSAMSRAAVRTAAELGYTAAVLQASEQGESVYRALGFRPLGPVAEHRLSTGPVPAL
ncbi:MAG: GNAT family N-acetyltransferase [Streptomycetaceae bacterium]|nr:GNAT family N-acetyltransferase [Streptomycetaceae bacterium]